MADNAIAYGFEKLQDLFTQRVTAVAPQVLDDAIQASATVYDEDLNTLLSLWVDDLEGYPKMRVELPSAGELQPLSQNGVPVPTRMGARYEQGFPFARGGDSFGGNQEVWAKMTVGDMNRRLLNVFTKDARWNIRRILASVFTNTTWTYTDDNDTIGSLSVKGLASGDTDSYMGLDGSFATAQHYTAQASAIDNSNNPYSALYALLYAQGTNTGPFVAYIPPGLTATTQALSAYNPNPSLSPFVNYGVNQTLATDTVNQYLGFGDRVLGEVSQMIVVESRLLPAGYVVGVALGEGPFIKRRQEPEPELQGLRLTIHQENSNFRRYDFYRKAGYAVYRRTAAAVRRIGNGSYSIPAGFDASTMSG